MNTCIAEKNHTFIKILINKFKYNSINNAGIHEFVQTRRFYIICCK